MSDYRELNLGAFVRTHTGIFCVTRRHFDPDNNVTGYEFTKLQPSMKQDMTIDEVKQALKKGKLRL